MAAAQAGYKTHQASSTVTNTYEYVVARPLGPDKTLRRAMTYKISQNEWQSSEVADKQFLATLFIFDANRGANKDAPILGPKDGKKLETSKSPPPTTVGGLVKLVEEARCREEDTEVEASERKGGEDCAPDSIGSSYYILT